MKRKSGPDKATAEQVVKDIRRQTRRQYSAEEKIRIVLEGLRGEENISELCRREGIAASMYHGWSKEFLEAGKRRLHHQLRAFYSDIGRPSVDPELMIRMLLVGYCYGIRHERRLCQEAALHLAYRWFCKLDLDDKIPHHSTFSVNRLGRFRESEILRHIFERVVTTCMAAGLVKGEGFAVDASVMEANASRYHGKAPGELDWTDAQRQKRAVAEYLAGLEAEAPVQDAGDSRDGVLTGRRPQSPIASRRR
jgi:transposase